MKILVFSDSHGRYVNMQKAIKMHPDACVLLHSGDGLKDLDSIDILPERIIKVNGNYEDGFFGKNKEPGTQCVELGGKKIFICHGHRHNVNFSMQKLIFSALEKDADIAVYGHTHVKHNEYIPQDRLLSDRKNGLYIFNPGSISLPRDGIYPSFGLIEIKENGILLSHGLIK